MMMKMKMMRIMSLVKVKEDSMYRIQILKREECNMLKKLKKNTETIIKTWVNYLLILEIKRVSEFIEITLNLLKMLIIMPSLCKVMNY